MNDRATITVHTSPENKARLARLAKVQDRSVSYLGDVAIERYLEDEEAIIAGIEEGIADADAGRLYTGDEVRRHLRQAIEQIAKKTTLHE